MTGTLFILRPHQTKAIELLRERMRMGDRRIVLELCTSGGKTQISVAMIQAAVAKGGRCVFVVNRTQLLEQTVARFAAQGIDAGIVQGKNTSGLHKRVIVISIATLHMRPDLLPRELALVVIDEAHACGGDTRLHGFIHRVHAASPKTAIVGLTATPWSKGMARQHKEVDGPLFQSKVCPVTADELVDQGYLCDCTIYAPAGPDMTGVKITAGEYDEDQAAEKMDTPELTADIVETYLKHGRRKKAVLFACNIAHSRALAEEFQKVGIDARHIDYREKPAEKTEKLRAFDAGEFQILCNPLLLREGWDAPSVEVLILARPTKSLISWVQMAGRVLRTHPGKDGAIILDHSGTALRLGYPTDDRSHKPLSDGKPASAEDKAEEKKADEEKLPKPCYECHFLKPAGVHVCPACGHAPRRPSDVDVVDGELVLIKKAPKHIITDDALRFGSLQELWSMLLQMADDKGLKPGWAYYKFAEITGGAKTFGLTPERLKPSVQLQQWSKAQYEKWKREKRKEEQRTTA